MLRQRYSFLKGIGAKRLEKNAQVSYGRKFSLQENISIFHKQSKNNASFTGQ